MFMLEGFHLAADLNMQTPLSIVTKNNALPVGKPRNSRDHTARRRPPSTVSVSLLYYFNILPII